MDDNEMKPDTGPTRPMPVGSDEPLPPLERLHRLLASSEEETAAAPQTNIDSDKIEANNEPVAEGDERPGLEAAGPEPADQNLDRETAEELQGAPEGAAVAEAAGELIPEEETAVELQGAPVLVEDEEAPAEQAPVVEPAEEGAESISSTAEIQASEPVLPLSSELIDDEERHPTGEPEQTGGWFADIDQPEEVSNAESQPSSEEAVEKTMAHETGLATVPPDEEITQAQPPALPETPRSIEDTAPTRIPSQNLPKRVDQVDVYATRVTPAAYGGS